MIEIQTEREVTPVTEATCSIDHCPQPGVYSETAPLGQWLVTAYFCDEHQRELEKGIPMGGLTLNTNRLLVEPRDPDLPAATDSTHAISPQ